MPVSFRPWNLGTRDNLNLYLFMGVLVIVGAVFGALLVNALTFEQQQDLADELGAYVGKLGSPAAGDAGAAFRESFFFYARWIGLIWLLGVSVIGLPIVLVLDFLKGVLIGFAVGLIVRQMAWKGLLFAAAAVAPQNALIVPALLVASVSASRFAYFIVRERLFRRKGQLLPPFLAHTSAALLMILMTACAALYEAYVAPALLARVSAALLPASALAVPIF
jgi:stage II sporulation protein M